MRAPTPLIAVNFSALVESSWRCFDLPLNEQFELLDLLLNLGYQTAVHFAHTKITHPRGSILLHHQQMC